MLTAAPVGLPPMRTCAGVIWPARPSPPSPAPPAWRGRRCASMPTPGASPSGPCAGRGAASSTRSSPTWKREWPRDARTRWRSGARCGTVATRTVPRWCRSGWPSTGRGQPRGRPGHGCQAHRPTQRLATQRLATHPALAQHCPHQSSLRGCWCAQPRKLSSWDAAVVRRTGAGQGRRPGRLPRTPVHRPCPRVRHWAAHAPRRACGRPGHMARQSACVRHQRRRDVRRRAGAGRQRSARRARRTLEQRPGRGPGQPPQDAETAKLWSRQLRPVATTRSDASMIHAKRGRATSPGRTLRPTVESRRGQSARCGIGSRRGSADVHRQTGQRSPGALPSSVPRCRASSATCGWVAAR